MMNEDVDSIVIYTDGSCLGNPGPGGWAAILSWRGREKTLAGGERRTTNQRMELLAAVKALTALKRRSSVKLYSDSAYLVNAFRQGWVKAWIRNGFLTSARKPVENRDLWERLIMLDSEHSVCWVKVAGHSNDKMNELCDRMAREQAVLMKEAAQTD